MNTIKPNLPHIAPEADHNADASWKISDDPPPFIMGLQSQFAHLQLLQSKVCKEKAEESIRQVQESQKKQYDSRMYAAQAQKLLEKAKRDGTTDVNKELEAYCKQHGIPFKKLDIQKGSTTIWALLGSLGLGIAGVAVGAFVAVLGLLVAGVDLSKLSLKDIGKAIGSVLDLVITLSSVVREFLPKDLQLKLDSLVTVLRFINSILNPLVKTTPQQRKDELAAIHKRLEENPISVADVSAIFAIGKREGIFTPENARRVATDMGIDLAATLTELESFGNDLAAKQGGDTAWYDIEISESLAEILLYPLILVLMISGESYEDALKKAYARTKIGEACDADNWKTVVNGLEAMNAQEAGRTQLLMVSINNHIGQYNSYLQGAMTAIANANQVNTALAKGTG